MQALLGLSSGAAQKAVQEVLDCFDADVDEHIARRHLELQARGLTNAAIYGCIATEITELRFKAPSLTPRQIRRRIYG